jgi:hypothetical protein
MGCDGFGKEMVRGHRFSRILFYPQVKPIDADARAVVVPWLGGFEAQKGYVLVLE